MADIGGGALMTGWKVETLKPIYNATLCIPRHIATQQTENIRITCMQRCINVIQMFWLC